MKTLLCLLLALRACLSFAAAESAPVTRGQFLTALWEADGAVPFDANTPFTDLSPTDPCAPAVGWACAQALVRGVGGGRFAPDRPITRSECAVLLRRWAGRLGRCTVFPEGLAACNDYMDAPDWAGDDLYWACGTALLPWSSAGTLDPEGTLTAGEVRSILNFFLFG